VIGRVKPAPLYRERGLPGHLATNDGGAVLLDRGGGVLS